MATKMTKLTGTKSKTVALPSHMNRREVGQVVLVATGHDVRAAPQSEQHSQRHDHRGHRSLHRDESVDDADDGAHHEREHDDERGPALDDVAPLMTGEPKAWCTLSVSVTATTGANAISDPTDRSISRSSITKVTPSASIPRIDTFSMMFSRFEQAEERRRQRAVRATATPTSVTTRIRVWVAERPARLARRHAGEGPRGLGPLVLVATAGGDSAAVARIDLRCAVGPHDHAAGRKTRPLTARWMTSTTKINRHPRTT